MSLAEQIQRVDGGQNDILKAFLAAFGVTVGSNKIDQLASLAKAAPLLKENGILAEGTKTSFGLAADATVDDVLKKLSKAALVGEDGELTLPSGDSANQTKIEIGEYTGTGLFGQNNKTSITFRKKPTLWGVFSGTELSGNKMIVPLSNSFVFGEMPENEYGYVFMEYINPNGGSTFIRGSVTISYDNNTVSFYSDETADAQLNESSATYHYFAAYL